jgi:hypothetical protein
MRRRGRSLPAQVSYSVPPGSTPDAAGYFGEPQLVIHETPEEWRKHTWEPWRMLFPDRNVRDIRDQWRCVRNCRILSAGLVSSGLGRSMHRFAVIGLIVCGLVIVAVLALGYYEANYATDPICMANGAGCGVPPGTPH